MNLEEFKEKVSSRGFEDPDDFEIAGGVSGELIKKTELILGFPLNHDYKDFLREFGEVMFRNSYFTGLYEEEEYSYGNLDVVTKEFKEKTRLELDKKTLFKNDDDEWYLFLDNKNGKVISYDPFSKTFSEEGENIFSCLSEYIWGS